MRNICLNYKKDNQIIIEKVYMNFIKAINLYQINFILFIIIMLNMKYQFCFSQ